MSRRKLGFTLVELLVVIAIIGVLVGLLLPAVQAAREAGRRMSCSNNIRQLGLGMHNYESSYKMFPMGAIADFGTAMPNTNLYVNGLSSTLPYIEQGSLQQLYDFNVPWERQLPTVASTLVTVYTCPSNASENPIDDLEFAAAGFPVGGRFALTSYLLCKGMNYKWCNQPASLIGTGMFDLGLKTDFQSLVDGSSSTILAGETVSGTKWAICKNQGCTGPAVTLPPALGGGMARPRAAWIVPQPLSTSYPFSSHVSIFGSTFDPINKNPITATLIDDAGFNGIAGCTANDSDSTSNFASNHTGGCNFVFADGSVKFLTESTDINVIRALSTTSGGEITTNPD